MIKKIIKRIFPEKIRYLILGSIPKIIVMNTYVLSKPAQITDLNNIDKRFFIRTINIQDLGKVKKVYSSRSKNYFERIVLPRLHDKAWIGLGAYDDTSDDNIAYVSWIVKENREFIDDIGLKLNDNQFFVKDGYCVPKYRHLGLHTRLEQERINYCVAKNASAIFIQIAKKNIKGIESVTKNGYIFYQKNYIISINIFGLYRELFSLVRSIFHKKTLTNYATK